MSILNATWPGASYLWNTGATSATLTASTTGTYTVDVDLNGCVASDAVDVMVLSATSLNLGPDVTLCTGEQVTLDATTAGATYLWSNGATTPTLTTSTAGTFWAQVTSGICSVRDTVAVSVNPMPQANLGPDVTLCAGEDIVLDASWLGSTYLWSTGATTASITRIHHRDLFGRCGPERMCGIGCDRHHSALRIVLGPWSGHFALRR